MKKLILAVLAIVLGVVPINLVQAGQDDGSKLRMEMAPVYRTIKRGDRLWDYAKQYNLNHPKEIIEFNKGKAGAKCIKSENLILRRCKIAIPVYTQAQARAQQVLDEKALEEARVMERAIGEEKNAPRIKGLIFVTKGLIFVTLVSFFSVVIAIVARSAMRKRTKEAEKKITDLSYWLLAAEDAEKTLKAEKEHLFRELHFVRFEFAAATTQWAKSTSVVRFKTQNGEIAEFDISKVRCKYSDCNTEVLPQNALSHYFQQHPPPIHKDLKDSVDKV